MTPVVGGHMEGNAVCNLIIQDDGTGRRLSRGTQIRKGKFTSSRTVDEAARYLNLDSDWLQSCLDRGAGEYEVPKQVTAQVEPPPPSPHPVAIRDLKATGDTKLPFASLADALACTFLTIPEPLIVWEGTDRLCALDVDLHHVEKEQRFTEFHLKTRFANVQPAPRYIWVTHGRGLRLIYEDLGGFTAHELASVGACRVRQLDGSVQVELRTVTRHPAYPNAKGERCSRVEERTPTTDVAAVQGFAGRGEADEDQVAEWLEDRGLTIGQRYDHDRCPVDPTDPSEKGPPVVVYSDGIMCFRCQGKGVRRGSRAPGWFPFPVLLGNPSTSDVARCVENFIHWEHARFILTATYDLPESILRGAYATMLKGRWPNDPRIPTVFVAGQDIVRFHKRWGTLNGEAFSNQYIRPILENLPACRYIDTEKQQIRVDGEKVARFLQTTSLERYGYPHLRPIHGIPMSRVKRYPYEIILFKGPGERPQYLPKSQRIPEETAWLRIQNAFPGHNRAAIQLLICAKGCAELDGTWPPFVFIDGPTKSAKTTSVLLAAAIAGDGVHSVPCISDDQRIRAAVVEAKERGTYCVFNEAVKDGRRMGRQQTEAMEFALGLTADSMSHKLYVGPVEMGQLPVCVWTDTYLPSEVKRHAQLARRLVYIHFDDAVDWHTTMLETGMGKAERLRVPIYGDKQYVEAADCILSTLMDRFFESPMTFEQIANELGFHTLADSEEARDQIAQLQHFYELVQAAPKESGEVVIELNRSDPLSQLWHELADPPDYMDSQRCREVVWQKVLKADGPVRFHVTGRRSRVRVRFDETVRSPNGIIQSTADSQRKISVCQMQAMEIPHLFSDPQTEKGRDIQLV